MTPSHFVVRYLVSYNIRRIFYLQCQILESVPVEVVHHLDPCYPSPCGPNAQCRVINLTPSCSCLAEFVGSPPNCRPECSINAECPSNLACIREKCRDPCPGSCGAVALCNVHNHIPICRCPESYTGNPFSYCQPLPPPRNGIFTPPNFLANVNILASTPLKVDPCNPSPCGPNALCLNGVCSCLAEFHGDAYSGCRPECVLNNECPKDKACIKNKCSDPCPGICGENAICNVINHIPMCTCIPKYAGNAFIRCLEVKGDSYFP